MEGDIGHMGGLINPAPGGDNTEPVFQIPVGLSSLERGRRVKKFHIVKKNRMRRRRLRSYFGFADKKTLKA